MIEFFSEVFGYILNFIYSLVSNYGIAIILFSILLKLLLLPLSIKQQKTMKKTQKIQDEVKKIQDKYKNNPEKLNQEIMDLYKRENLSPFSGCLSSIIQIILLFAMFYLVRSPLTYMSKVDNIEDYSNYIKSAEGENSINPTYPEISIIKYANKYKNENQQIREDIETNLENFDKVYINMDFCGLDLSNIPTENYTNITVFIIPVLYVLSSFISIKMTTRNKKSNDKKDIIIDKDKVEEEPDMTTQMNKSMSWMMPIMSVTISLVAPLGLALYWLVNNIIMIIERLVLDKVLSTEEDK